MKSPHVRVEAASAADPLLLELIERAHALRPAPSFSDAEHELRRVHVHESARGLVRLAVWSLRSSAGGGAAWLWPVPALSLVVASAREEVRFARRDAAPRVPLLERCAAAPMEAWPAPEALVEAAFALRPCPETLLARAFADLARALAGSAPGAAPRSAPFARAEAPRSGAFAPAVAPRSAAIDVLSTCSRPRPRALAFGLLGFSALLDQDAAGARGAFEAAHRLRPADARLAWLARQVAPASDARRDRARSTDAPAGLRRAFEAAARGRGERVERGTETR